jgi:hypothetical protein
MARHGPLQLDRGEWCIIWDALRGLLNDLESQRRTGIWDYTFGLYLAAVYRLRQRIGLEGIRAYRRGTMQGQRSRPLRPHRLHEPTRMRGAR